jgi:hypothetical protein
MTASSNQNYKRAGNREGATPAKPKKPVYISINLEDERAKLRLLGYRDRWAYLELKGLSNFKTGACGEFKNQRLTYCSIAALITAPGVQGRGDGNIDDTQAADILKRLEAVGLVANIDRLTNGGLRFDLPLSPINRVKLAQSGEITPRPSGEIDRISPETKVPEITAVPMVATVFDEFDPSPSVMINKLKNISNEGAGSAVAETAPRTRAMGAAPVLESSWTQPPAAALTAREIGETIAANWTFTGTDSPEAQQLYVSWADAGITLDALHDAMTGVEEDENCFDPTPALLVRRLWPLVVDGFTSQLSV